MSDEPTRLTPVPQFDTAPSVDDARAIAKAIHGAGAWPTNPLDAPWRRTRANGMVVCDTCLTRDLEDNPPPPLGEPPAPNPAPAKRALIALRPVRTPTAAYAAGHCARCGTYYWRPL